MPTIKNLSPFEAGANPAIFYESEFHEEALARLLYITADQGMNIGVITGKIGSGKTLLCKKLCNELSHDKYATVYIPTANIPYEALIDCCLYQITGNHATAECQGNRYLLMMAFNKALEEHLLRTGRHLVIVLDECQMLNQECLENLKCLTNSSGICSPLTLILCGQPEFNALLNNSPTVNQRVGLMYFLPYLNLGEIESYISFRLRGIGKKLDLDSEALELIYEFSNGCPREINKVCKLAYQQVIQGEMVCFTEAVFKLIIDDIYEQRHMMTQGSLAS
jgi:type II secretory pathway predicted ATPase ExeA